VASIADSLAASAATYGRKAARAYVDGAVGDFYLFAGTALEHAMKSRLAAENVAFIAPEGAFKFAVALNAANADISQLPVGTRTIAAAQALTRVVEVDPTMGRHAEAVLLVLRFRNGEVHIGSRGRNDDRAAFAAFAAALTGLLRGQPDSLWGEHAEVVRIAVDENVAMVHKVVAEKLGGARVRYRQRFDGLEEDVADQLLALFERERRYMHDDGDASVDCPACEGPARCYPDIQAEEDGTLTVIPAVGLECLACGLHLATVDELEAAGVDRAAAVETARQSVQQRRFTFGLDPPAPTAGVPPAAPRQSG
jgi:hypothetical protein